MHINDGEREQAYILITVPRKKKIIIIVCIHFDVLLSLAGGLAGKGIGCTCIFKWV